MSVVDTLPFISQFKLKIMTLNIYLFIDDDYRTGGIYTSQAKLVESVISDYHIQKLEIRVQDIDGALLLYDVKEDCDHYIGNIEVYPLEFPDK